MTGDRGGAWTLMRQDDNGNRYVVARFGDHAEAEAAAAEFEARGHKQLYWVERTEPVKGVGSRERTERAERVEPPGELD